MRGTISIKKKKNRSKILSLTITKLLAALSHNFPNSHSLSLSLSLNQKQCPNFLPQQIRIKLLTIQNNQTAPKNQN